MKNCKRAGAGSLTGAFCFPMLDRMNTHLSRRRLLALTAAYGALPLFGDKRVKGDAKPLGVAILGLGDYATKQIAPAFTHCKHAKLTGIITGSPEKIPAWQEKHEIPDGNIYSYENMAEISKNKDIDVVYVITPTGTHADFSIRAFEAGKHVICEKPMAPTVADCTRMIEAAQKADRMLQIGYRLYWDPYHTRLITAMRDKEFGDWTAMETGFGYKIQDKVLSNLEEHPDVDWRVSKDLGIAGALYDVGVYAIQGAFYGGQIHPTAVTAKSWTDRKELFEVPEHWEWELEYADGRKSKHTSSYGGGGNYLHLQTEEGKLHLDGAYGYEGQKGETPLGPMDFAQVYQQVGQLDGQMLAILKRKANITPAEMGRRDIRICNAVMEAAESGNKVPLKFEY